MQISIKCKRNQRNHVVLINDFLGGNFLKSWGNTAYRMKIRRVKAHIPLRTAFALGTQRRKKRDKQHEMYMANAKMLRWGATVTYITLEMGFALATNANEIYKKEKKCTWPTQEIGITLRKRYQRVGISCVRYRKSPIFCVR